MLRQFPIYLLLLLLTLSCRAGPTESFVTAQPSQVSQQPSPAAQANPTPLPSSTWTPVPITIQPPKSPTPRLPTASIPNTLTVVAEVRGTMEAWAWPTAQDTPDDYNLIDAALARGEIDVDHATVYRLYALFDSPQLPLLYSSPNPIHGDALGALAYAIKDIERTSRATQKFATDWLTPREITVVPTNAARATPTGHIFPHAVYLSALQNIPSLSLPIAGQWRLDLTDAGRATLALNGKRVITREYAVRGNQISFVDEFGSYACEDNGTAATYTWSYANHLLVLTHMNDACELRAAILASQPWRTE